MSGLEREREKGVPREKGAPAQLVRVPVPSAREEVGGAQWGPCLGGESDL